MKSYRSLLALFLALGLHVLIALPIAWTLLSEQPPIPPSEAEHFTVRFGEESLTDEPDPIDIPAPEMPRIDPGPETPPSPQSLPVTEDAVPIVPPSPEEERFTPDQRDRLPRSVLHHYGEAFFDLSAPQQHYIIDNLQRIRKLNEIVGTRLLRERYHDDVDPSDNNVVEFTLRPDGSISNLRLEKNRIGTPLDELTLQTINLAHPKYPKPAQETKIRIRVYIIVRE